jgi:glycosyltransferase involved in cell wall biosynthesis
MRLSIVICAHNPRESYLRRVLEALRLQTLATANWELLVVDNASTEPVDRKFDLTWHANGRHVLEEKLGLSFARRRGALEATGDVVLYVDDDNVLAPDYLARTLDIMSDETISALGGAIVPVLEPGHSIPAFFYSYAGWFACGSQCGSPERIGDDIVDRTDEPGGTLFGAGIALRRKDLLDIMALPHFPLLSGRSGKALSGGEDLEICHLIAIAGGRVVYSPLLQLEHHLPPPRMDPSYLRSMVEPRPDEYRILNGYHAARRVLGMRRRWIELAKTIARIVLRRPSVTDRLALGVMIGNSLVIHGRDRPIYENVVRARSLAGPATQKANR